MSAKLSRLLSQLDLGKSVFNIIRTSSRGFQTCASCQGSLILERFYKVPLSSRNKKPRMKTKHSIYKVVGSTPSPKELDVILTKDSLEFGVVGEVLTVSRHIGRKMIRDFEAVYASPENLSEFSNITTGRSQQSATGRRMLLWLRTTETLKCPIRPDVEWTLNPEIICRAFYRAHNLVVPTDALELPEYEISSKSENCWGKHPIKITVNKTDTVDMTMDVIPWTLSSGK